MEFNKTYFCKVIGDDSAAAQRCANTLLHKAVSNCSHKEVERLLKSSIPPADVNALDQNGFTPLYLAVEKGDLKLTKFLLKHNANANHSEYLPLVPAVKSNCPELVRVLLQYGADPNMSEEIIVFAVKHGNEKIVKILLEYGADANVCYKEVTLLEFAIQDNPDVNINIVHILLQHGARIVCTKKCLLREITDRDRKDVLELLIKFGANLHARTNARCMYELIQTKNVELLRLLLKFGTNVFAPNDDKKAINFSSYLRVAAIKSNREIIDVLTQYGANVRETDLIRLVPLSAAIGESNYVTAYALILNGARTSTHVIYKKNTIWPLVSEDSLYNVCLAFLMIGINRNRKNTSTDWLYGNKEIGYINDVLARFLVLYYGKNDKTEEDVGSLTNKDYGKSLVKLKVAGLPLSFNQTKRLNKVDLSAFSDICTEEVRKMKKTILHGGVTLFHFLRATKRSLTVLMRNSKIEKRLLKEMKSKKFENYKVLLWINYMRGIHYRPVYAIAHDNLDKACDRKLPHDVLVKILNYLTIKDMYSLYQINNFSNAKSQYEFHDVFSKINTSFRLIK